MNFEVQLDRYMSSSINIRIPMCNQRNGWPESSSPSEILLDQPQPAVAMDASASASSSSSPASTEDSDAPPRVKFLCSFGGSILPRPLDGKLRYVGGETRIVTAPRNVSYDELMSRMLEIFEGAMVLKYQQPDEDLDALVSVVNDDDVMNMMEEYDKLGAGDGFTRLRLFLFSHPDHDSSPHYDSDERETERRYVDALNSLTENTPDYRKLQPELDTVHGGEQLYGPTSSIEIGGGLHNHWNPECSLPPINVHHIAVPHPLSGQHSQSHTARYNEMEAPRSPAYYSPGPHAPHDARSVSEFPPSPSSGRYRMPFGDLHDKSADRKAEEYVRHPAFADNVVWLPSAVIPNEKAGFPGNLGHSHNAFEGNNICEHCRMAIQRNQAMPEGRYPDTRWRHGQSHIEQSGTGNEFTHFSSLCTECLPGHETYVLNPEMKLEHGIYTKEQNEHRPYYNETHLQERGWALHHPQMNHRAEEARPQLSGAGRVNEQHYVMDSGMNVNFPFPLDSYSVPSNCINHEETRYVRSGIELGNEGFHEQTVGTGHHVHVPPLEECGIRYGNFPPAYGVDNHYQVPHGSTSTHSLWRKVQNSGHGGPSYETSGLLPHTNGMVNPGFLRGEGSPRFSRIGVEDQNPWGGHYSGPPQKAFGVDGPVAQEYSHDHIVRANSIRIQENQPLFTTYQPEMLDISVPPQAATLVSCPLTITENQMANATISGHHLNPTIDTDVSMTISLMNEKNVASETKDVQTVKELGLKSLSDLKGDQVEFDSNGGRSIIDDGDATKLEQRDASAAHDALEKADLSARDLSFLPELIASVKRAAIEGAEEVKAKAQGDDDVHVSTDADMKETSRHEAEPVNANNELEHDSDSDQPDVSKIEPTKAEEEALARGLQTIKNDDLEEIRELGSGTYGAVYHGKWKGSDVAIKRIKASCFAGKPSDRERLIADFWKEALILSSLHHPNVVSFYGIVRDGPDGSLATVTEFMVNGSLKQFLQKKDRTIDRRKRLIIAMDAAFGMEYLHGKNIVHFDLKCENLLVNMRDPHRPVCKIGDLGLSKVKQHTLVSGGIRGTLPWMAPELLSGKSNMVTEKIDIYSFGIVMWEVLTGEEPYGDMHCASIIGGIVNNTLRPQIPTWCDPEWKSLMESCWASDPSERPSFSQISQKLRKMAAAINVK